MRIGIITHPLYANYGGILQNYALQQVLKKMGHEPVTLDYMPSLSFGRYLLYAGKGALCSIIPSKRHPIKPYAHFLKRPASIDSFVHKEIALTKTIPNYTRRILHKNGIETIIVGSDQVWRYSYNSNHIEDMYLAFVKNYPCLKIAYGASFGVEKWDYPEAATANVKKLIKRFDAVSVREDSGRKICKYYLDIDSAVVIDPTLLLNSSDYDALCDKVVPNTKPYLAAYVLDQSEEKDVFIQSIAKEKNLQVKKMTVSENGLSVEQWLSIIKDADFIITDSYHGTLFSILFRKQFLTIINRGRGADRFVTILKAIGLEDRLVYDISTPLNTCMIDYSVAYEALDDLRLKSYSFLYNSLNSQ